MEEWTCSGQFFMKGNPEDVSQISEEFKSWMDKIKKDYPSVDVTGSNFSWYKGQRK